MTTEPCRNCGKLFEQNKYGNRLYCSMYCNKKKPAAVVTRVCALEGCDKIARRNLPNSCCCEEHRRARYRAAHPEQHAPKVQARTCACGCGEKFTLTGKEGNTRKYKDASHKHRARMAAIHASADPVTKQRRDQREQKRKQRGLEGSGKPRRTQGQVDAERKSRVTNIRVSTGEKVGEIYRKTPVAAMTYARLQPMTATRKYEAQRMDMIVLAAWQQAVLRGDECERTYIERCPQNKQIHFVMPSEAV